MSRIFFVFILKIFIFLPFSIEAFDFNLKAIPSAGEVIQGQTFRTAISLELLEKPSERVRFTISKLPFGVSAEFSPSSCKPPCSSFLKIYTKKNPLPGEYLISIIASGKGVTKEFVLPFKILPSPSFDFSLQLSHKKEEILPGEKIILLGKISPFSFKKEKVNFYLFPLSEKIKAKISPTECLPPCNFKIFLETSKDLSPGKYSLEIVALGGEVLRKKEFTIFVLSKLEPPFLIAPKNNSFVITLSPYLKWSKVKGAEFYFGKINGHKFKTKKTYLKIPFSLLKFGKNYQWKVKSCKGKDLKNCSKWSKKFEFKVIPKRTMIEKIKEKIEKILKEIQELQKKLKNL